VLRVPGRLARPAAVPLAFVLATWPVASPANAHVSPRLRIAAPEDGSRVSEGRLRVIVVGEGGDGAGLFTLALDGTLVDTTGKVGGTFTTLSVLPGRQTELFVHVGPGEHELRLSQAPDTDNTAPPQGPVTVRFTAVSGGGGTGMLVLAGVVLAGAVGGVVAVRRRAGVTAAGEGRPGDRPGAGPDAA
jgi:hypothetical protein